MFGISVNQAKRHFAVREPRLLHPLVVSEGIVRYEGQPVTECTILNHDIVPSVIPDLSLERITREAQPTHITGLA